MGRERIRTDLNVDGHDLGGMVAEKIEANEVGHLNFLVEDADAEWPLGGVGWGRHGEGVGWECCEIQKAGNKAGHRDCEMHVR